MPYLVANNAFTAQSATIALNPNPAGSYAYRSFGTKCVYAANVDRVVLAMGDGENSNYTSSWWHYDVDARALTRMRPDPTNLVGNGIIDASSNGFQDFFGAARGDNRHLAYHPGTGTVWEWGGNAGGNSGGDTQDSTWFNHYTDGVYIFNTLTAGLIKPNTTGMDSTMRHLSAGCGWDPNINKFLQVLGESGGGGFSTTDTQLYEIDPSTGPGGTATRVTWAADGIAGPLGRSNIGHQFVYHSRARKWILFGGNNSLGGGGYTTTGDTWSYDAVSRTWTNLNPNGAPEGRAFGFMWYDSANNVIVLTGGTTVGGANGTPASTTWVYSLEYNTWTNIGVSFTRTCGGVAYDPTRNLAILTPGSGLSDVDFYTFRYAVPRASMLKNTWYSIPLTSSGKWCYAEKHVTASYMPSATPTISSGKVYIAFGDPNGFTGPMADGIVHGESLSYQQVFRSLDLGVKFDSPTNLDAGAVIEHGWCVSGGDVVPKHWDYCGLAPDIKRRILWCVPGTTEYGGTDSDGQYNCIGETGSSRVDDAAGYLGRHMISFDPTTQKFTDRGTNHGVTASGSNDWPYITWYDPLFDRLIRFEQAGSPNKVDVATNLDGGFTWTQNTITGGGGDWYKAQWAFDPQRRLGYIAERESSGHLYSYNVDTRAIIDLGVLPGTPLATFQSEPSGKGYTTFDHNARMLVYVELTGGATQDRVWKYDVDSPAWTQIDGLPQVALDGGTIPGTESPYATTVTFDPDNNMVLLIGSYVNSFYGAHITRYWAIRLSDMGVSSGQSPIGLQSFKYRRV